MGTFARDGRAQAREGRRRGRTTARSTRLEDDGDNALGDGALEDAGAVREETQHAVILAEHVGTEAREAPLRPCTEHLVQEQGAQPLTLIAVFQQEGDLAQRLLTRGL